MSVETLWNRMTDRLRQTLIVAERAAKDCGHHYVGVEHLLMSLERLDEPVTNLAFGEGLGHVEDSIRAALNERE